MNDGRKRRMNLFLACNCKHGERRLTRGYHPVSTAPLNKLAEHKGRRRKEVDVWPFKQSGDREVYQNVGEEGFRLSAFWKTSGRGKIAWELQKDFGAPGTPSAGKGEGETKGDSKLWRGVNRKSEMLPLGDSPTPEGEGRVWASF